jgi:nucleosome assembly protein 1-like 1
VKKKQKSKRGKNAGATRVVTKVEAKPSFFRFFESIPLPGDDDEALGEDAVEELRDKIDADVELAFALRNEVVPKAILWFTGEAVDDDDEDFDDQDYDSEDA